MSEAPVTPEASYEELIKKLDSVQEGDTIKISTGSSGFMGEVLSKYNNGMVVEVMFPSELKEYQIELIYKAAGSVPPGGIAYEIRKPGARLADEMVVVQPMRPSKTLKSVSVIPGKRERPLLDL